MLVLRTQSGETVCVEGGSRHGSRLPSGRSLQTNQRDGRIERCVSASTSWTGACEGPGSERAGPRLVVTQRLSWVRWSRGCGTLTSSRLEGPALSCPSPVGPRLLHARQGHPCSTLKWTECPWTWEDAGRTESRSRVWWSSGARPPGTVQAGPGELPTYPRWGSVVEHRSPTRKAVRLEVGSECVVRHSPGSMAGQGAWEKASRLWTGPWGPVTEQNKKETKDSPPGPPPGEGVVRSPSPEEQDPEAPGRPSQGRRLPWRFTGLAGAEAGCAAFLRPAPRCGRCEGCCCCGRAGAEVEAAGGRPRRRADGGAAAGSGLETAADRRGRMWRNASVCFCAAENWWANSSTASPNRPAWEIGESRKRCLSDSLISAKVSHRWRSWTTNVDIVWPRVRAVTFVTLRARSVAVHSSCNTPGSAPHSCNCFNAGGPWRAGWKRPVQQHRKPWPLELTFF